MLEEVVPRLPLLWPLCRAVTNLYAPRHVLCNLRRPRQQPLGQHAVHVKFASMETARRVVANAMRAESGAMYLMYLSTLTFSVVGIQWYVSGM